MNVNLVLFLNYIDMLGCQDVPSIAKSQFLATLGNAPAETRILRSCSSHMAHLRARHV
jgi:hypothetical protein